MILNIEGNLIHIDRSDYKIIKDKKLFILNNYAYLKDDDLNLIALHRYLLKDELANNPDYVVNHVNLNRFDNRRSNLEVVSSQKNSYSQKVHSNSKTGIPGVVQNADSTYSAYIRMNKKKYYLGTYKTANSASDAYNVINVIKINSSK